MKKINFSVVTLLVIALTLVFASCTKDGVYKPKKKISKIYETVTTAPNPEKQLKEVWFWDGKLLSKIDYGDDEIAQFTYEKKQLKSIVAGDSRIEMNYDSKGKYIDNFKLYYKNDLQATYTFEHGDKHLISGYTIEYADDIIDKSSIRLIENVFRFITPEIATDAAAEYAMAANSDLKGNNKYTVTLSYDGKNVIDKVVKSGDVTMTYTYTYTEYLNPFYGLFEMDMDSYFSKNAVSTYVRKMSNMPDYNYDYTYQVDGKVPTQMIEHMKWEITMGGLTNKHEETIVTDFEYLK